MVFGFWFADQKASDHPSPSFARYTIHPSRMPDRKFVIKKATSMNIVVVLLTLFCIATDARSQSAAGDASVANQTSSPSPDVHAEAELRAFMAELRKASIEGAMDTVANSLTDDYVQTDINGYRQDKTTWLNEYFRPLADLIKGGKFHWDEYERKNLQFRFYGDCAIVTGELQAKGTGARLGPQHTWVADPNASFSATLHFTHVYIKRNGKWMLAALHNQMPLPLANVAK
jgi:ketosteroid isomerase-like protein